MSPIAQATCTMQFLVSELRVCVFSIVAVHGLNGNAPHSFIAKDSGRMWLSDMDMLPRDIKNCRVLTYNYPASIVALMGSTSSDRILQHAQTLVAELVADRQVCFAPV